MRLTVKTKLAGAFAVVVVLTGVVGFVGYIKLAGLNDTLEQLVSQRVQMQRLAQDLSVHLLKGIRAEKNVVLSSDDGDIASYSKEASAERQHVHVAIGKLEAVADSSNLLVVKKVEGILAKFEPVQDKVIAFGTMNSNFRAHFASMKLMPAKDKILTSINAAMAENPNTANALRGAKNAFYELWSDTQAFITTPTMSELADFAKRISDDRAKFEKTLEGARAAVGTGNGAVLSILDALDSIVKSNDEVIAINSGAGNIQAGDLSSGDGAKLTNDMIAVIDDLVAKVGSELEADRRDAAESYSEARTLLISLILAAIAIAIGCRILDRPLDRPRSRQGRRLGGCRRDRRPQPDDRDEGR